MTSVSKDLATVGQKQEKKPQQNQTQGGTAIYCDWLRVIGGKKDKRQSLSLFHNIIITIKW